MNRGAVATAVILAVILVFVGVGCGGSSDANKQQVEEMIEDQFSGSAAKLGSYGSIGAVSCVDQGSGEYVCYGDARLDGQAVSLQFTASCDDDYCIWKAAG